MSNLSSAISKAKRILAERTRKALDSANSNKIIITKDEDEHEPGALTIVLYPI